MSTCFKWAQTGSNGLKWVQNGQKGSSYTIQMSLNGFKMAKKVQATCFKWAQMGSNGFKMVKQFK